MANITVNFKGLTGIVGSVLIDESATLDALITAISTEEGLDSNYYSISKEGVPSASSNSYSDSSTTLDDLNVNIGDGDRVICTPVQTGTKEYRQIQKLDIAQRKRTGGLAGDSTQGPYYRPGNTYDRDKLPTKYTGDDVTDNPNVGGLLPGRPWS